MSDEVCKEHSGLVQTIVDVKDDTDKQWLAIDKLRNRPPVWCTILMMVMSGFIGSILTYAALVGKLTQAIQAAN